MILATVNLAFAVWSESKSQFEYTSFTPNICKGYTYELSGPNNPDAFDQWQCSVGTGDGSPFFRRWQVGLASANMSTSGFAGLLNASAVTEYTLTYPSYYGMTTSRIKATYNWFFWGNNPVQPTETFKLYLDTLDTGGYQEIYSHSEGQAWNAAQNCFLPRMAYGFNVLVTNKASWEVFVSTTAFRTTDNSIFTVVWNSGETPRYMYPIVQNAQVDLKLRTDFHVIFESMNIRGYFNIGSDILVAGDCTRDDVCNMRDIAQLTLAGHFNQHYSGTVGGWNYFLWLFVDDDQIADGVIDMRDIQFTISHFNEYWYEY